MPCEPQRSHTRTGVQIGVSDGAQAKIAGLVFLAKDGEEALQIIESNQIDIILTDIRMPKIDGLQLIASLEDRIEDIKVIILRSSPIFQR